MDKANVTSKWQSREENTQPACMAVQTAVILPKEQLELNLSLSPVSRCAEAGMYEEGRVSFYRAQTVGVGIGRAALQPGLDPTGMEGEPKSDSCPHLPGPGTHIHPAARACPGDALWLPHPTGLVGE